MTIDGWTLGLQIANVLVLVWLLQRFLYRPVAAAVAQRQKLAVQALEEARQAREQAEARKAALSAERADLAGQRERVLAEARLAAHEEQETLLARAAAEAQERLAAVDAQLSAMRQQWQTALETDARRLAVQIAGQLLARLPRAALTAAFMEDCCRALMALPADQKQLIRQDCESGPCRVVAAGLDDGVRDQCRRQLRPVLGDAVTIEFEEQPALVAGVELHFRRLVIRNSWAHDLDLLQEALSDHGRISTPA